MSSSARDGRYLAASVNTALTAYTDTKSSGYAVVWDLRSPSEPPVRLPTGETFQGVALSPDGQTLYTGWPLTAYDVATGERIWRREEVTTGYVTLDVNAQGTLLALADNATQKDALLVDAADGTTVATLRGHRDLVRDIRFSPDGTLVGSVSSDWRAHRLGHRHRPATGTVAHLRCVGRRLQPGQ